MADMEATSSPLLVDDLSTLDIQPWNQESDLLSFLNSDDVLSGENSTPPSLESFSSSNTPTTSPIHQTLFRSGVTDTQLLQMDESSTLIDSPLEPTILVPKEEPITTISPDMTVKSKANVTGKRNRDAEKSQKSAADKRATFNLTRDDLLKLSSRELEDYAHSLSNARPLTTDEEKQLKRQRRLIKNRESAQLSRMRKKVYIEELEKKVAGVQQENEQLRAQVLNGKKLQEEVVYLQNIIKQYQAVYGPLPTTNNMPTASSQNSNETIISVNATNSSANSLVPLSNSGKKGNTQKNIKTASVCLLMILFSFGLLFNAEPQKFNFGNNVPIEPLGNGRALMSISNSSPVASELQALSTPNPGPLNIPKLKESVEPEVKVARDIEFRRLSEDALALMKKYLPDQSSEKDSTSRKKMKIMEQDYDQGKQEKGVVVLQNDVIPDNGNSTQNITVSSFRPKENTNYLYCPQAQQVAYPSSGRKNPENVALLIPSALFQAGMNQGLDASLLEVSCQVMSYYTWPSVASTTTNNNSVPQ